MRPLALAGLLMLILGLTAASPLRSEEVKSGPLSAGQNVPGSFQPYNVTAREIPPDELEDAARDDKDKDKYTSEGKFHCLVSEYDLDPVVILFARGLDMSEGFQDTLKKLDADIIRLRGRRLRAFVVFILDDKDADIVKDDDRREDREKQVRALGKKLNLKRVVLTLAANKDLTKYELNDRVPLTAVFYRTLRIRASHTFARDELDKADAPAVKTLVTEANKLIVK